MLPKAKEPCKRAARGEGAGSTDQETVTLRPVPARLSCLANRGARP